MTAGNASRHSILLGQQNRGRAASCPGDDVDAPTAAGWQGRERVVFHAALFNGAESVDRMLIPDDRPAAGGNDWYVTERRRLQKEINRGCGTAAREGEADGPVGQARVTAAGGTNTAPEIGLRAAI